MILRNHAAHRLVTSPSRFDRRFNVIYALPQGHLFKSKVEREMQTKMRGWREELEKALKDKGVGDVEGTKGEAKDKDGKTEVAGPSSHQRDEDQIEEKESSESDET